MAQRLVRTLCPLCKRPYNPDHDNLPDDFPLDKLDGGRPIYRAVGCRECRRVGYVGRVGLFELMPTSDTVRQLAHDRATTWKVEQQAVREGMRTLRKDGWLKVLDGRTTIDEVVRVTRGRRESEGRKKNDE